MATSFNVEGHHIMAADAKSANDAFRALYGRDTDIDQITEWSEADQDELDRLTGYGELPEYGPDDLGWDPYAGDYVDTFLEDQFPDW